MSFEYQRYFYNMLHTCLRKHSNYTASVENTFFFLTQLNYFVSSLSLYDLFPDFRLAEQIVVGVI